MSQNVPQGGDRNVVVKRFTFVLTTSHHVDVSMQKVTPHFVQNICFESHEQGFEAPKCHLPKLGWADRCCAGTAGESDDLGWVPSWVRAGNVHVGAVAELRRSP